MSTSTFLRRKAQPRVVVVGQRICGLTHLKGYNTFIGASAFGDLQCSSGGAPPPAIVAAANGLVEEVDRVVSVRGDSPRYVPEVGDVVIVKVVELGIAKWVCDCRSHQLAILLLSNATEPGGVLRRRGRDDESNMRQLFAEGDFVVAEVQRVSVDGVISLHTRAALKYGKVDLFARAGVIVDVRPSLLAPLKQHFTLFASGVALTIGRNGRLYFWCPTSWNHWRSFNPKTARSETESTGESAVVPCDESDAANPHQQFLGDDADVAQALSRYRNSALSLHRLSLVVSYRTLDAVFKSTLARGVSSYDLLLSACDEVIRKTVAFVLTGADNE